MLALMEGNVIVGTFPDGGWFELPDGSRACPAHDGWQQGDLRLAAIVRPEIPAGSIVQSEATEIVNGAPTVVYTFAPPPTAEEIRAAMPSLTPRQLCLVLPSLGLTEAMIEARIAAIADPTDRTYADIEWRRATYFKRTHWLVVQIAADLEFAPEEMDSLWLMAAAL